MTQAIALAVVQETIAARHPKASPQKPESGKSLAYGLMIHSVREDGSCQHLCRMRFARDFSDTLKKG